MQVEDLQSLIIDCVNSCLKHNAPPTNNPKSEDTLLNVEEAAELLSLTKPTIYSKVSRGELPVMKGSKRLYFSRTELMDYLRKRRRLTNDEVAANADLYLHNSKNR